MTGTARDTPSNGPLRRLRGMAETRSPLAPVHAVTCTQLREIEPGHCEAAMPLPVVDDDADPLAATLVLGDFVLGLALTAMLAPGERITTLRLSAQLLADPAPGGDLHASGRLNHRGNGTEVCTADITDAAGTPLARCTGRNAVLTDPVSEAVPDRAEPLEWAPRPLPVGLLLPGEVVDDGAEALLVARPDPRAANTAGVVQGGVLAAFAARGLGRALGGRVDEIAATFLRAVPADGAPVTCRVIPEHTGRRLRSARAELYDARDRLVLTASALSYAGAASGS